MNEGKEFPVLWEKAALRHGHKCSSLYYGVMGTIIAINKAKEAQIDLKYIVLEGKSRCIKDGCSTVWQREVTVVSDTPRCAISIADENQAISIEIRNAVRQKIGSLLQQMATVPFRNAALDYLRSLTQEQFVSVASFNLEEFSQLRSRGKIIPATF